MSSIQDVNTYRMREDSVSSVNTVDSTSKSDDSSNELNILNMLNDVRLDSVDKMNNKWVNKQTTRRQRDTNDPVSSSPNMHDILKYMETPDMLHVTDLSNNVQIVDIKR